MVKSYGQFRSGYEKCIYAVKRYIERNDLSLDSKPHPLGESKTFDPNMGLDTDERDGYRKSGQGSTTFYR